MDRYQRQVALIGEQGQEKIQNAKVMIIGLGGIGCPAAQYLVASGVGRIALVDNDRVAYSNLHRQILFTQDDVGFNKAEIAKKVLSKVNPEIIIDAYPTMFDLSFGDSAITDFDLIIDGTDNYVTRYLVNDLCVLKKKVFISCSILKNIVQIILFDTKQICYRCVYPSPPPAGTILNCSEAGILGTVTGIAGTMTANLALNHFLDVEKERQAQMKVFDARDFSMSSLIIKQNEECISCKHKKMDVESLRRLESDGIEIWELDRSKHFLVDIRQREEREVKNLMMTCFFRFKKILNMISFYPIKIKKWFCIAQPVIEAEVLPQNLEKLELRPTI